MKSRVNIGLVVSVMLSVALIATETAFATDTVYDRHPVNGHAGFLSAWRITGELDKPVIVVKGYDTVNSDHPIDDLKDDFGTTTQSLTDLGYDIIIFDYVNGEADLKENADNLAEFIRYLDGLLADNGVIDRDDDGHPDYELVIIGGSMGGIVARTMFVQENERMGADIFVTIDSPHHGVQLSPFLDWATEFIDSVAGRQMYYGDDAYFEHYDWLRSVENGTDFKARVIDPMHTAAIALSNGEAEWHLDAGDLLFNTEYHNVSSFIENQDVRSDYVPYHSAVNMDNTEVVILDSDWDFADLIYIDTHTSYFDLKIPNPRDRHGAPDYVIRQAIDFVIDRFDVAFADVPTGHWAFSSIESLSASGITSGCGGGNYCPENPATRAQMAVLLERSERGGDFQPAAGAGNVFLDVPAGYWAGGWIELLSSDGITTGCGNNNYCPEDLVTREQMAVFLLRAKHGPDYAPPTPTGVFVDVPLTHWAAGWIEQLYAEGITLGCGPDSYCPKDAVSRAQMAVFLVRTFAL
jgi:pimeloyl-ACP methyl ester carboxylesterase